MVKRTAPLEPNRSPRKDRHRDRCNNLPRMHQMLRKVEVHGKPHMGLPIQGAPQIAIVINNRRLLMGVITCLRSRSKRPTRATWTKRITTISTQGTRTTRDRPSHSHRCSSTPHSKSNIIIIRCSSREDPDMNSNKT